MEANFGGPVWHASAAQLGLPLGADDLREKAFAALEGVGDDKLGQWQEWTGRAYHVRRRLTPEEITLGNIGEVVDVRGTWEGTKRINAVRRWMGRQMGMVPALAAMVDEESRGPA